jgi:hypothetical protein
MEISNELIKRGYVKYSDFGAKGDGVSDDYNALFAAHEFANAHGLDVFADEGAVYYIHVFEKSIKIKTNTTFTGAKFILDDTGSEVFKYHGTPLFLVDRDNTPKKYEKDEIEALFPNASIPENAKQLLRLDITASRIYNSVIQNRYGTTLNDEFGGPLLKI